MNTMIFHKRWHPAGDNEKDKYSGKLFGSSSTFALAGTQRLRTSNDGSTERLHRTCLKPLQPSVDFDVAEHLYHWVLQVKSSALVTLEGGLLACIQLGKSGVQQIGFF